MTKIRQSNLDNSIITGNTTLSGAAAEDDVLLVYDTSSGGLKKVTSPNVGLQSPTVSSVSPTNVVSGDGTGNHTFTIAGTKFASDVTATLVNDGGTAVAFDSVTRNSSTQITGVIAKSSLLNSGEPFDVKVTNAGALTATLANQINVDASPVFITASGSLGTENEGASFAATVNATDPESAGNVTFELQSGALPGGITFANTAAEGGSAVFSGTAPQVSSTTTFNFVLRAVDAASNTTSRAFSITSTHVPVRSSFTSSGSFSVPAGVTAVDVLVVAGGAGAGNGNAGGGGAGGLVFMPEFPVQAGTITVTVGDGSTGGSNGSNSHFGGGGDPGLAQSTALNAIGGGYGEVATGNPGGSGGGSGTGANGGQNGSGTQPTQPANSGAYGFGNSGGAGNPFSAGGGGGAGAGGVDGHGNANGGAGKAYTIANGTTPVYYAGGGGGYRTPGASPSGGQGGGGGAPGGNGQNAQANKGGGAGGGGPSNGAGGRGIVIVAY